MLQAPWERSVRDLEEAEPPIVAGKSKSSYDQTVPKESFLTIAILEPNDQKLSNSAPSNEPIRELTIPNYSEVP